jgi:predicted ester cyclase
MADDNIATARRVLEEAFSEGRLEILDEVLAEGFVDHDPIMGDQDRETVKRTIAGYRDAFPDLQFTVDDAFAAGDKVVLRWTGVGTFEKEFMGQRPTGEKGDPVMGISIDRFDGEKIAESWVQWDTLTFLRDIGAMPEAAGAATAS